MKNKNKTGTPRWIFITTGIIGIVSAVFIAVTKYYEIHKARAEAQKAQAEVRIDAPVSHILAEPPFDKYLRANPILLEVAGVKVIYLKDGSKVVLSVASTVIKDESADERIRAEKVCRIKAATGLLKEKQGVQIAHAETLRDGAISITTESASSERSVAEVLEMTTAKVEGVVKEMPPVGRWKSADGVRYSFLQPGSF
jgi:hypothetical protein